MDDAGELIAAIAGGSDRGQHALLIGAGSIGCQLHAHAGGSGVGGRGAVGGLAHAADLRLVVIVEHRERVLVLLPQREAIVGPQV